MRRYHKLAADISRRIHEGVLRPGDRLPSVREARGAHNVSASTVIRAYQLLEARGEIASRARSGYYVRADLARLMPEPGTTRPPAAPVSVNVTDVLLELLKVHKHEHAVRLGSAFPGPQLFPMPRLARMLHKAARLHDPSAVYDQMPPGNADLRRLIARRYMEMGCSVPMEEIVVTNGALEALSLCVQAVTRPGDLVAIECPAFYLVLEAIERLGLKAIEIPTHPRDGMDVAALADALKTHPVKACWLMTNFQNPLGSLMPEAKKDELVRLLAKHGVPLIEDDVYGELYFGSERPKPAKARDRSGLVLHCSSFSKSLAPGYRVGWTAPGRFFSQVNRAKIITSIATSGPGQIAVVEYLKDGGYNHHLRKLRRSLEEQQGRMLRAVARHFPEGCRITRPAGGFFLWVEMPESVDAMEVYRRAAGEDITVAPGPLFSARRRFGNCLRLNYGRHWSARTDTALAELGGIVGSMA